MVRAVRVFGEVQKNAFDCKRHENTDSGKNRYIQLWDTNENEVWNEDTEKIRLYRKKMESERNISRLKLDLQGKHKLSGRFIENTINWLKKNVRGKTKSVKIKLSRKFKCLLDEKAKLESERRKKKKEEKEKIYQKTWSEMRKKSGI